MTLVTLINNNDPFVYTVQLTVHPHQMMAQCGSVLVLACVPSHAAILAELASTTFTTITKAMPRLLMDHQQHCMANGTTQGRPTLEAMEAQHSYLRFYNGQIIIIFQ